MKKSLASKFNIAEKSGPDINNEVPDDVIPGPSNNNDDHFNSQAKCPRSKYQF